MATLGKYLGTLPIQQTAKRIMSPQVRWRPNQTVQPATPGLQTQSAISIPAAQSHSESSPAQPNLPQSDPNALIHRQQAKTNETIEQQNPDTQKHVAEIEAKHPNEPLVLDKKDDRNVEAKPVSEVSPVLLKIKAVFPFDFFPDELVIEQSRIIINHRYFFWTNTLDTVFLSELKTFEVTNSVLFSSITITGNETYTMGWLKRSDAIKAKQLVDGLLLKENDKLEIPADNTEQFVAVAQKIGEADI